MTDVQDMIYVEVEYFDGLGEGDYGTPYYVASCVEITASTDGETLDEVVKNVLDMIELYLKDTDTVAEFNIIPKPRIVIIMELPENYAKTA